MWVESSSLVEHLWWNSSIRLHKRRNTKVLGLIRIDDLWTTRWVTKRHSLVLLRHQRSAYHLLRWELLLGVRRLLHAETITHWLILELLALLHLLSLLYYLRWVVWWWRWWRHQATFFFLIILVLTNSWCSLFL